MDSAQKLDKKNGIICLISMFTPRVMVILVKMSKNGSFFYCLLMAAKNQSQFGQNS